MINNEKYYSTEEVSEILNVKKATIRSWIFKGLLPVNKFGRCVRVPGEVVERLLQDGLESLAANK